MRLIKEISVTKMPVWLKDFHCQGLDGMKSNWYESEHGLEGVGVKTVMCVERAYQSYIYRFIVLSSTSPWLKIYAFFSFIIFLSFLITDIFFRILKASKPRASKSHKLFTHDCSGFPCVCSVCRSLEYQITLNDNKSMRMALGLQKCMQMS